MLTKYDTPEAEVHVAITKTFRFDNKYPDYCEISQNNMEPIDFKVLLYKDL